MKIHDRIELAARRALDNKKEATEWLQWYELQVAWAKSLAVHYELHQVLGVIAAMSPQVSWDVQLEWMPIILDQHRMVGTVIGPGFNRNKRKAQLILDGTVHPSKILSGRKVLAFYHALMGDLDSVTIDRHAFAIAYGVDPPYPTDKRCRMAAAAYASVAACLRENLDDPRLNPRDLQALVWCWWRERPEERF